MWQEVAMEDLTLEHMNLSSRLVMFRLIHACPTLHALVNPKRVFASM